ncbi:RidA family protein [Marimonas sp. MJW-29]|uniref:RidA family protein n=1 Tax=Sulfitobacter sediminis TaxID=3234186 RepID=A0ABV3RK17_9RHOB
MSDMRALNPDALRPPFGAYSHGTEIPAGMRLIRTSGQLGIGPDDSIPESTFEQARLCFENIRAILAEGGMGPADVAHISAYVTAREYMTDYMRARYAFIGQPARLPSSTLVVVTGFTRPEFKVEVEVWAAKADQVSTLSPNGSPA